MWVGSIAMTFAPLAKVFSLFLLSSFLLPGRIFAQSTCSDLYAATNEDLYRGYYEFSTQRLERINGDSEIGRGPAQLEIVLSSWDLTPHVNSSTLSLSGFVRVTEMDGDGTQYFTAFNYRTAIPAQTGCLIGGAELFPYETETPLGNNYDVYGNLYHYVQDTGETKFVHSLSGQGMIQGADCFVDSRGRDDGELFCQIRILPVLVVYYSE